MNRFTIIFLILFFLAAIIVGVVAVRQRLSLLGTGVSKCPEKTLPGPDFCPKNQTPKLFKDEKGCYIFICQ